MGEKRVKNAFFQKSFWTIWEAQTSVFDPFLARGDAFWPMQNPKMP